MALFRLGFLSFTCTTWLCATVRSGSTLLPRQGNPNNVWVTIDASGNAETITPSVTTTNDAVKTVSGAPEYVTRTSVYTMTTAAGHVETLTGMAPVATATASSGAGAFAECINRQGRDSPFCLPRRGSVLKPGTTYYVTWDPSYFATADTPVSFQVRYADNGGFATGMNISADTGYYAWPVDDDVLSQNNRGGSDLVATLHLVFVDGPGEELTYAPGPKIAISKSAPLYDDSSLAGGGDLENHNRTVAIAVPVVVVVVVVLISLGAFALWSWRRHGRVFGIGSGGARRSSKRTTSSTNYGWPEDKSHGIQLTDRESWSPAPGRNVFREEIERHEMQRGF